MYLSREEQGFIEEAEVLLRLIGFTNYHIKKRSNYQKRYDKTFLLITDLENPRSQNFYYSSAKGLLDGVRRLVGK